MQSVNERGGLAGARFTETIALRARAPVDEPILVAFALVFFVAVLFGGDSRASRLGQGCSTRV